MGSRGAGAAGERRGGSGGGGGRVHRGDGAAGGVGSVACLASRGVGLDRCNTPGVTITKT
jgi:hypothetical protein